MNKKLVMVVVGVLIIAGGIVVFNNYGSSSDQTAGAGVAFDALGYNRTARIFNGTGATWCESKGLPSDCVGIYSPDKLIMKWTEDWDRGNDENWANPPYDSAWIDNEWNGKKDGSGDRKSTRLNSSHSQISYAVFCLKKTFSGVTPSAHVAVGKTGATYPRHTALR